MLRMHCFVQGLLAVGIVVAASYVQAEERPALAKPDILLRAVGFALTGSDNAKVQPIDRANCVFRIEKEVFHLNNVHLDRLIIQSWVAKSRFREDHYLTVALHGDKTIYEQFADGLREAALAPDVAREWKRLDPSAFEPSRTVSNETTLKLPTNERDRVSRAWQFIYANGCTPKASPF
jgi:hypothetical protein